MAEQRIELQPHLTAIAQLYRNPKCIADDIFPSVKVEEESFQYRTYSKGAYFSVPETRIGEKGKSNKIELNGKLVTETVENHSLEEDIPIQRLEQAEKNGINLVEKAANQLTDLLKIRKDITLSAILSNKTNYSNNFRVLETSEKLDLEDVNAVKIIQSGIDSMLYKANTLVTSRKAMSALRQNPYIVDACGTAAKRAGIVPIEGLKTLFDLDKIFVGESVMNAAKKGQTVDLQACWQNDISLLHIDETADTNYGITFGFEAFYNDLTIGSYFDGSLGTKGCDVYKAFYSSKYLSICPECGYLIKDILSE